MTKKGLLMHVGQHEQKLDITKFSIRQQLYSREVS